MPLSIALTAAVTLICVIGGCLWLMRRDVRRIARTEAENRQSKEVLDDVAEKNRIHDRLQHDSDYADRVRERFTRS